MLTQGDAAGRTICAEAHAGSLLGRSGSRGLGEGVRIVEEEKRWGFSQLLDKSICSVRDLYIFCCIIKSAN
jgi:hypothetical protein